MPAAGQFELADPPSDAISSLAYYHGDDAPDSTRLLISSWDKHVYLYDTSAEYGERKGQLIRKFEHRAPVLAVCFGASENEAFTAGLDWQVKRINLESGEETVLSAHDAGVNCIVYDRASSLLVSSSWDSSLHLHYLAQPSTKPLTITLPAKPHSVSLSRSKLIVAMSSRLLHIYELSSILALPTTHSASATSGTAVVELEPWQTRESSLKFMTRATASMPDDSGYACSSIEGRVAVEWFDPSSTSQSRKYAFKCHRQAGPAEDGDGEGIDIVYPVNALAFHPVHGTFASGGGDGFVALWDALGKRRIRQYQKYPHSVAALEFSANGNYLAIAICPGFEDGMEAEEGYNAEGQTRVFIRELGEKEAMGKGPKA